MFNITWSPWPFVHGSSQNNNADFLDYYLYNYAFNKIRNPHTGTLYNLSLPANLSGVELSFSRIRTRSLWRNGTNQSSYFSIPPWTLPWPFSKRVDLIYQNLGNWSTSYYNVPNHKFVAPVLGFLIYDPNTTLFHNNPNSELKFTGKNPIIVRFPNIFIKKDIVKCVRFDLNGTLEFSDMVTSENLSCVVTNQGHFSIVTPNQADKVIKNRGIVAGIVVGGLLGLVVIIVVCVVGYVKWIKRKRLKKMEKMSELSVALETLWIGRSKMPFAAGVRTYPVAESRYVP
ncbi:hypothetical protein PHJA_001658300 [Phtheirospermum japonicum]|uniref:Uncharacterized protein n=1 Tax=Phtheirospermum japonicum TaxID=374723 RepID=A0A830C7A2_9LAMI|nr:hypothetical protein PHJA_001658300 [Phtheirospermum japonicum]